MKGKENKSVCVYYTYKKKLVDGRRSLEYTRHNASREYFFEALHNMTGIKEEYDMSDLIDSIRILHSITGTKPNQIKFVGDNGRSIRIKSERRDCGVAIVMFREDDKGNNAKVFKLLIINKPDDFKEDIYDYDFIVTENIIFRRLKKN